MIMVPKTWEEATGLGAKVLWLLSRVHFYSLVIGAVLAIVGQLLTGFWSFRSQHQATIIAQYKATLEADKTFEEKRRVFETVFFGVPAPDSVEYREVARAYVQQLEVTSDLLPSTRDEFEDYVAAIAALQKYYAETNPPAKNSLDGIIFYGEYRIDYDQYVTARQQYLGEVADTAGSYWRYLWNS
ncbi:MAG: hypothetical protein ACU0A4_02145 [Paracoccaceae bacterium]